MYKLWQGMYRLVNGFCAVAKLCAITLALLRAGPYRLEIINAQDNAEAYLQLSGLRKSLPSICKSNLTDSYSIYLT